jgi:hypothetical protein
MTGRRGTAVLDFATVRVPTERLNRASLWVAPVPKIVVSLRTNFRFLFLGALLGFGNITMPLMTHDHNRRGFLVEWSITRNH